jgi:hypothetical protein
MNIQLSAGVVSKIFENPFSLRPCLPPLQESKKANQRRHNIAPTTPMDYILLSTTYRTSHHTTTIYFILRFPKAGIYKLAQRTSLVYQFVSNK